MKFIEDEREEDVIEVIKYAMPSPMCLNRPMITIMDHVSEKSVEFFTTSTLAIWCCVIQLIFTHYLLLL